MALTLETDGRRVEEFSDADSALERAVEDPSVALVVTDLKMPARRASSSRPISPPRARTSRSSS